MIRRLMSVFILTDFAEGICLLSALSEVLSVMVSIMEYGHMNLFIEKW
jgi:hypothetical protein